MVIKINPNPPIPALPRAEDKTKVDIRYSLIAPYANAHIYWDSKEKELIYDIEEPSLNSGEREVLERLEEAMIELINVNVAIEKSVEGLTDYLDKTARLLIEELNLKIPGPSYERIFYYIYRDFVGLNDIEPLLRDYFIEDIECNGVKTPVYIVHRAYRNIKTNLKFNDMEKLANFVEKLAQRAGKYISYAEPLVDGTLPDGSLDYQEPVVYKENGIVKMGKIGEVVDKFYKDKEYNKPVYIEGIEVAAFDDKFKINWKKADYVYRHKVDDDLYKLKLEFGRKIKLTGAHSIFSLTKDGVKSVRTDKLNEGDYVVLPVKLPENDVINEINLAGGLSKSEYKGKLVLKNVPSEIYNKNKEELYEYYNKNYKRANQAYYEHKKKKILPVEMYHLLTRDDLERTIIGTTSGVGINPILKINKELMRFLGLYISEGWITETGNHHRIYFCLNKKEKKLIEDLKTVSKECFGINIYVEPEFENSVKLTINSYALTAVMKEILKVSRGAKNKRVPEIVFNVSKELQKEFIRAWNDGDYGTTVSKGLADDISYLALFNEDIAAFYKSKAKKTYIKGREVFSEGAYYTNFYARKVENSYPPMIPMEVLNPLNKTHMRLGNKRVSKERLSKLLQEIRYKRFENIELAGDKFTKEWEKRGFIENRILTKIGTELIEEMNLAKKLIESDFCFAKIKKISREKSSADYVYDFSISGDENFVGGTGGICCHNSRINATYTEDVTSRGPSFTIRKFTKVPWTPTQLIALNTLSPEMMAYFWLLIQYKSNIFITGGTASGKTTLLNALSFFIPPEARVVSIEDSVTGDSKIIIKEEDKIRNITIKEFVDNKIDAKVMTVDEKGKIAWVKPSNYIKHKVKKDIYEVLTSTGRKVKVTQDHSLFSLGSNNEFEEVKPTELVEGKSFIAVPRSLPISGNEINEINLMNHLEQFKDDFLQGKPLERILAVYSYKKLGVEKECYRWWKNHNLIKIKDFIKLNLEFSYDELKNLRIKSKNKTSLPVIFKINQEFLEFCGLWLGDGSYDNRGKNCVILSNVDEECIAIFKRIAEYIGSNYSSMNDGGVSLRIHSTVFYKFMKNVLKFDGYSNTKKIPEFIFNLSNEQIKHFIRGYFSADGCMKKYEASCASQSYDLLEDLQTLFLRLNIISRINDFERKDKCINMSISSSENIRKFKEIGFLQERKNEKLLGCNFKAHHTASDIIPLSFNKLVELNEISKVKLQPGYLKGMQRLGRDYMQQIAPTGSEFNDISHTDILWDKVKKIKKISSEEVEVFDLSIPKYEKFLCNNIFVHNTREINIPRENWIPAIARISIGTGNIGEIDLFDLLKNSFRQNPDYVIVGEVRGKEAFVLFQGMASGHPSISTMHADSVDSMVRRLQTPPIELSPTLINSLDAIAIMSHAIVGKKETRRLRSIVEVVNVSKDGTAIVNTPFVWNPAQDAFYFKKESKVFEKISVRFGVSVEELQAEFMRRAKLLYTLYKKRVFSFGYMARIVNEYYKNPEAVLKAYGIE